MIVYIAGPMTGLPDFNYPAFHAAAATLTTAGHVPLDPARPEGREGCKTWADFMRAALRDLAEADGVAMLPEWEDSRGASLEHRIGIELGLDVRPLAAWTRPSLPDAVRGAFEQVAAPHRHPTHDEGASA